MKNKQYPLHHDHGTVTISRDVFESMTAELERLRPMECSLELAEADRDAYKKKVEELKGELKDIADDRNEFKQLYSEQTEELCIEKTNVDTLEQAWRQSQRALWIMTAEWAEAMGLASCNIANKFMSRENFEVGDDYRQKTIKKYRHRQVVFSKYADYCRNKAKEYR